MSKVEVDQVTQQSGTTLTVGGGACKTAVVDATTVTLGRCGGTVSLASGATQSGFGRTGTVDWQTGSIKTTTFTAVDGEGYFVNSPSALTMNLPAGSPGAIVAVSDYARNFETYSLSISANGSELIGGQSNDAVLDTNGQVATFVYVDGTKGWINVQNASDTETGLPPYITATGGTVSYCGNFKIHTFTGPGTFDVVQTASASPSPGYNTVSYAVVGGAAGSGNYGGGGGAGGFREYKGPEDTYTASPLDGNPGGTAVTVTATSYPITVGAGGGTGGPSHPSPNTYGDNGTDSIFSTITSTGGGGGGGNAGSTACHTGKNGGSGGGQSCQNATGAPGSGNTPPTTPSQGNNGGTAGGGGGTHAGGGGGGATAVGGNGSGGGPQGAGGAGATTHISGSPTAYAGGGGGGGSQSGPGGASPCGTGGGFQTAGSANRGGGGGGSNSCNTGGSGGSGVVIIRYRYQ